MKKIDMMFISFIIFVLVILTFQANGQVYVQPQQLKLSYGGKASSLIFTWVTFNYTESVVEYGTTSLNQTSRGSSSIFTDGGALERKYFIHRVYVYDLKPGERYMYHVGSRLGWSSLYFTTVLKQGTDWSPRFAIFGDLGNKNAQSMSRLQRETQMGNFDMILHVGDMAYDMDTNDAQVGDEFSRQIETMAAYVPYMTVVGNHEYAYNFSNYVNRFTMPNSESNFFYSFDVGPVHFVAFSTEFYFFVQYGWKQIGNQFDWLDADLKKANFNRKNVPWIITMGHRPMYCSNWDSDDCTRYESIIRTGLPFTHAYALEPLFYKYGVDLELWAHEHSYERMYPLYNRTVYNGTEDPYDNYIAPVHIVTGSAGCQENTDPFVPNPPPWSAFRSSDYGYSRMVVHNSTHLYFEQISDDKNGTVIDSVWLKKDRHGSFLRNDLYSSSASQVEGYYVPFDISPPSWFKGPCRKCDQF